MLRTPPPLLSLVLVLALIAGRASAQTGPVATPSDLPDSAALLVTLTQNLRQSYPRLLLDAAVLDTLRARIERPTSAEATYYARLVSYATELLERPALTRELDGRRLLHVSREAVRRIGTLALVWRLSGEPTYAQRLDREVTAVASFDDWNRDHFLDVAEAAYAVAIGLDWGHDALSPATTQLARAALVDKALQPAQRAVAAGEWWTTTDNNWAQVCHGGLVVAALAVADGEPELAAGTLARAFAALPRGLGAYAPDGAYPEGASYWAYATHYTALTVTALETALGSDFGLSQAPGFIASANFSVALAGPTGAYFNYFDASVYGAHSAAHESLLAFFAARAPGRTPAPSRRGLRRALLEEWAAGKPPSRFAPAGLTWLARLPASSSDSAQQAPRGLEVFDGANPVAVLRRAAPPGLPPSHGLYLAAKGGRAELNHGNMDAGAFVFELDGVRWAVDPGNQPYGPLESIMGVGDLWDHSQQSPRWDLLTKIARGHSTLVIDGAAHRVDGQAEIAATRGDSAFTIDLTAALDVPSARRTFAVVGERRLRIVDELELSDDHRLVTWQLITRAEVSVQPFGALLTQDGHRLAVTLSSPVDFDVAVIPLDPPPLPYDKSIPGLKRLELRVPADQLRGLPLEVVLSGG